MSHKILINARNLAYKYHMEQTYGAFPYTVHLEEVATIVYRILSWYNDSNIMVAAAYLHDILEDTGIDPDEILKETNQEVFDLVWVLTKPVGSRKEVTESYLQSIRNFGSAAVLIKLADRIANTRFSRLHNPSLYNMYRKEYIQFKEILYREDDWICIEILWDDLDRLNNIKKDI